MNCINSGQSNVHWLLNRGFNFSTKRYKYNSTWTPFLKILGYGSWGNQRLIPGHTANKMSDYKAMFVMMRNWVNIKKWGWHDDEHNVAGWKYNTNNSHLWNFFNNVSQLLLRCILFPLFSYRGRKKSVYLALGQIASKHWGWQSIFSLTPKLMAFKIVYYFYF